MTDSGSPRRVCVVRFGGIGDILLSTPAIRTLTEHFPDIEIDYIVGRGFEDALTGLPYIRHVIGFDKKGKDAHPANFLRFARSLRANDYDLFLNFQPSVKTSLLAFASGAKQVLTYRKTLAPQPPDGKLRHAVEDFLNTLVPLGITGVKERRLDFCVPDSARAKVQALLREVNLTGDGPLVVMNPAASHLVNRWPPSRIASFLDAASEAIPGVRLGLLGGPEDVPLAQEIIGQVRSARVVNFAGRISFKELGALLEQSSAVVTADTGPMHIATAVGAPVVALFGPADPDRTGPVGPRHLVVVNRDGLDCVPCRSRRCYRGDNACMVNLPVPRVLEAVRQQIQG